MNQALITSAELDSVMAAAIATGLLSSTATIQRPSGTFSSSGVPDGAWVDVLADIRCQLAPIALTGGAVNGSELRQHYDTLTRDPRHILLDGYYPQIDETMRAVIDGVPWDIESVEHDSQKRMTRLLARVNQL